MRPADRPGSERCFEVVEVTQPQTQQTVRSYRGGIVTGFGGNILGGRPHALTNKFTLAHSAATVVSQITASS